MVAPAILCRGLVKRYGDRLAVAGIDLEVDSGECFGLLGPNGAGKTTTVEMFEGLTSPDAGEIALFGQHWGKGHDQELRERLGVHLQDTQLADRLTVLEVLTLFRSFYPKGPSPDELLRMLSLEEEKAVQYARLSGGQKQRVSLGCALSGAPDLLFLDEPTTGLDPRARQTLWRVVEAFRKGGGTVILTTHYMEEAAALCDRIAVLDRGHIIALGTPRSLIEGLGPVQFVDFEVAHLLTPASLAALSGVEAVEQRGHRYRLRIERSLTALRQLLSQLDRQGVTPIGLSTHQATLDDVFLSLTGHALTSSEGAPDTGSTATSRPPSEGRAS